jgi:phage anti-repressor protein
MNQIAPKSINFSELVKTSNTTLSLNVQDRLVDKLNTNFIDDEQRWYVANLYMFMNYHATNDYPINLEHVFKMIGFANKGNAMKTIKSNFTEGEDYKTLLFRRDEQKKDENRGGHNKEDIMLNVDTFKNLCMLAKTDRGKAIRKYYVKLENVYNEIIIEEMEQNKRQLQEQQRTIKRLENKPETEGFVKTPGYIYLASDKDKLGHYKIGLSNDPNKRIISLNCGSSTNSVEIVKTYKSKDTVLSEKVIHSVLNAHRIRKQKEWFYIQNDELLTFFIKTIQSCIDFTDAYTFNNLEEELQSIKTTSDINVNGCKPVKLLERSVQTDIEAVNQPGLQTEDKDEVVFKRFLNDSCIVDGLEYVSIRELVYQYKTWSKINSLFNYKDFEQYITGKFVVKKMFNKMFNCDMRCVVGINLKRSFYTFDFKEPISDFENFLMNKCVKLPTAKLNRSTLRDSYETWCSENGKHIPKKGDIDLLCKFLDKHFFKDYFYEGTSSYHGWYGITIKENVLRGTGITSTLCKRVAICKVHKDDQKTILQEWNSQKEASRDLGVKTSTLKYRLDNKSIFNDVYILIRKNNIL